MMNSKRLMILILLVTMLLSSGAVSASNGSDQPHTIADDVPDKPIQPFTPPRSNGAIRTVNSTDDVTDGFCNAAHCSLREAINISNNVAGMDTIRFDFNSATAILPNSELPTITDPVEIDGITDTGSTCPTASNPADLHITLSGFNAGSNADGLVFDDGSDGSIVRGLNIIFFDDFGIVLRAGADGISVECNHIGIPNADVDGFGNGLSGIVDNGDNNFIGGTSVSDRNVISANGQAGILLDFASDFADVRRNYIGTNRAGDAPLGNRWGVYVGGDNATIGWTGTGHNTISGNDTQGVRFDGNLGNASFNFLLSNYIGVGEDGTTVVPNGDNGVLIGAGASNNTIGNSNGHSVIANNVGNGIRVAGDDSTGNEIRYNEIFDNGLLGIDLVAAGDPNGTVTINDNPDSDTGPNGLQNHPILSSAENTGRIIGTFIGSGGNFTIDIYQSDTCDASGWGEGQEHLDTFTLTGVGVTFIDEVISSPPTIGKYVTAVATAPNNDTSEFGNCILVTEKIFVVNTVGGTDAVSGDGVCDVDNGTAGEQCTIIGAIDEVNALPGAGPYTINFDFPSGLGLNVSGAGLPPITKPTILDASSNPGASCPTTNNPATIMITFDGNGLNAGVPILTLAAGSGGSVIRGFALINGPADGILVESNSNVIACNHIGINAAGTTEQPNGDDGITITGDSNRVGAFNFVSDRNVISGNDGAGVSLESGSDDNKVRGNYIGTDASGTSAVANNHGVNIAGASSNAVIGGSTDTRRNVIAGNDMHGIRIVGSSFDNTIIGNYIGVDRTGSADLGNGDSGVSISNSNANIVGTSDTGERNIISGNNDYGVFLLDAHSTTIDGNYIGTDVTGSADVGNTLAGIRNEESDSLLIGGFDQEDGNIIAGNDRTGIVLINGTVVQQIFNNRIGMGANGEAIGNTFHGIHIDSLSSQVEVAQNFIAHNGRNGIRVDSTAIFGEFLTNIIHSNGWIGIDLNEDSTNATNGVTLNDTNDPDGGANRSQNFPVITAADTNGDVTMTLNSVASTDFTIQLFRNDDCDASGYGEGQQVIATFDVTTDASGNSGGTMNFPNYSGGDYLTATATRHYVGAPGETSEFSQCFFVPVPTAVELEQSAISYQPAAMWLVLTVVVLVLGTASLARRFAHA